MERETFNLDETAEAVGVSRRHLATLIKRGDGPPIVRLGRRIVVRRTALASWLAARESRTNFVTG
jgi:excisionase family DNA binding protein